MTAHCSTCERILQFVDRSGGLDDCWEWQRYRTPLGYGLTHVDRKTVSVHRTIYKHLTGEALTRDVHLLHQCDNPPCCNPRHLRPGDHLQNMADRKNRGAGYPKGLDNHKAYEVSDAVVQAIRAEYKWHTQGRGAPALAAKYGIGRAVVVAIVNRTGRWAEAS